MGNRSDIAKRGNLGREIRKHLPIYLMIAPGFFYMLINNYLPLPGLMLAFKRFKYSQGIWGSMWNGLNNLKFLFRSPDSVEYNQVRNFIK